MTTYPVIIVDIFSEIVAEMNEALAPIHVNYLYGRQSQILEYLKNLDKSNSLKDAKYPLLALFQDFPERRGTGYYASMSLPKIIIADLTKQTDLPDKRYSVTFKPTLYPIYYEFMHQLSKHPSILEHDENYIPHLKWDRTGTLPIGNDVLDYVDAIEINNLTFTVSQIKTC